MVRCHKCGALVSPDQNFCTACGAPQKKVEKPAPQLKQQPQFQSNSQPQSQPQPKQQPQPPYTPTVSAPTPKKSPVVPIAAGVAAVAVIVAAVLLVPRLRGGDTKADPSDTTSTAQEQTVSDIQAQDADITTDGTNLSFEGTVKVSTDSRLFLAWDQPVSIQLKAADGQYQLMKNISSVYLQNTGVDSSLWSTLPIKQTVKATGTLSFSGGELTLYTDRMTNPDGSAIVQAVQEAEPDNTPVYDGSVSTTSDEILPQSDDLLLTNADVTGLSLREINYAKNEIYARHGRKFSSPELQRHFDSCSWYRGTIAPENFKDSMLSTTEKKNADFLAKIEFSIDPKGYKLDA